MRSHLPSFSGMFSAVICVWWCAKIVNFASYCISNFLSLIIVRYYACLCGHEELVRYLLANGEQKHPPNYGCSIFLWSVGIVCPSSCALWKLLLLQPTIWSVISGYKGSLAHVFMNSFAGHLLLEFASWNCLQFLELIDILKMHRKGSCLWWLKAEWLPKITAGVLWRCSGVGNMLI